MCREACWKLKIRGVYASQKYYCYLAIFLKYFPWQKHWRHAGVVIFTDSPLGLKIPNLGILPTREPLYCSTLTGKCTRCVKLCLCLSLAMPLSNPTFQSKHERRLFRGSSFLKKNKKPKYLSNLHPWTWKCCSSLVLAYFLSSFLSASVVLFSLTRSVIHSINVLPLTALVLVDSKLLDVFPLLVTTSWFSV